MNIRRILLNQMDLQDDQLDGQMRTEIEYSLYARIDDFEVLSEASSKIRIEQATFYTEDKGKGSIVARSRKVVDMDVTNTEGEQTAGEVHYILTFKTQETRETAQPVRAEIDTAGSKDIHALFMRKCAKPLIKDRFNFPAKNELVWNVDVFIKKDGSYSQWARVEIEVPNKDVPMPAFPFSVSDWFMADDQERRDQLKEAGEIFQ